MKHKKGKVEIKFGWGHKLESLDKIDSKFIPLNYSLFLNDDQIKEEISLQLDSNPKIPDILKDSQSLFYINENTFKKNNDTNNTTDNDAEAQTGTESETETETETKTDTDTKSDPETNIDTNSEIKTNLNESSDDSVNKESLLFHVTHSDKIPVDNKYLEKIFITEKDLKLDDTKFTYDNPTGINKILMEVKLYDNMYEDEHKIILYSIVNFENFVKIENKIDNSNEGRFTNIINSLNEQTKDNDNTTKNELITDSNNQNSKQDETASSSEENIMDQIPKSSKTKISLEMNMKSGIIEPNYHYRNNISNLSSYNFHKYFNSNLKGNLKFNANLFESVNSENDEFDVDWKTILTQNLLSMKDIMELKLVSTDPHFPFNIKASLDLKEDKIVPHTFLFLFIVFVLGIC